MPKYIANVAAIPEYTPMARSQKMRAAVNSMLSNARIAKGIAHKMMLVIMAITIAAKKALFGTNLANNCEDFAPRAISGFFAITPLKVNAPKNGQIKPHPNTVEAKLKARSELSSVAASGKVK